MAKKKKTVRRGGKEIEVKETRMTNYHFSQENESFKNACRLAGVEATQRQASKYRNEKGLAWRGKK